MNDITYMWGFKPNETSEFPIDVINNNEKYVLNYKIAYPSLVNSYLNNDVFPCLSDLYNMIPNWVTKADLGRLLIIFFDGGLYSDADCFITKNINQDNDNHNIILFTEHIVDSTDVLGPRECKDSENVLRIANFCFGSKGKRHPFLKEVIDECLIRLNQILNIENKNNLNQVDILWACGPDVITTIYHKSKNNYNDIYLYDNTYLQHKCYGSWR